jgi:hypothetical protein
VASQREAAWLPQKVQQAMGREVEWSPREVQQVVTRTLGVGLHGDGVGEAASKSGRHEPQQAAV